MMLDDLIRFSNDLERHAGLKNTVRRMGDQIAFKVGGREFFFHRDGRYIGIGQKHHAEIADLVERVDPAATGEFLAMSDNRDEEHTAR